MTRFEPRPTGAIPDVREMLHRAKSRWPKTMRQLWNSTIEEEVPDDIKRLLDRLD